MFAGTFKKAKNNSFVQQKREKTKNLLLPVVGVGSKKCVFLATKPKVRHKSDHNKILNDLTNYCN